MDFWPTLLFSLVLLVAAAGLMVWHVRAWRHAQGTADDADAKDRQYRWRQFRRRMQTSAMLALLAVGLLVGNWITLETVHVVVFTVYWGGAVFLVLWITLLAVADMISTTHHFGRIRQSHLVERATLEAEARRIQASRSGGNHNGPSDSADRDA